MRLHAYAGKSVMLFGSALLMIFALLTGCRGKTGEPGASGTASLSECDACHHLSSLEVSEFQEIYVDGLAGSDVEVPAASSAVLAFDDSRLPAGESARSFAWSRINGQEAAIATPADPSTVVTLPTVTNYKAELVKHVKGLLVASLTGEVLSDRTAIVPVNYLTMDEASSATFKLRVAASSGKFYYGLVKVTDSDGRAQAANFTAINPGLPNVPVNVPVLLRAKTAALYNWSLTTVPASSATATMLDGATQFPHFIPDAEGRYVASNSADGATITLFAGTWVGAVTGIDENGRPLAAECSGCHDGAIAPDKFTPWMNSGHAEILTQNINDPGSAWTIAACAPCHSVGYNPAATNNGFDEAALATGWTFTQGNASNWTDMVANYLPAARLANIQCENCHGPNSDGTTLHRDGALNPERISLSADVCGACHGFPPRWAKFQQWEESAHGNFAGAIGNNRATDERCAGCHTAQGFMVMLPQLSAGLPFGTIPRESVIWTPDTAYPVTCPVCHDPHDQGTTSGKPNTARVRVIDTTPKLPAGFAVTGAGRGAICFVCHNSRNGRPIKGNGSDPAVQVEPFISDTFLHEDGDPIFGALDDYTGPHVAQGDVLMGHNAYFLGSGDYRSPHSRITDVCANCHMEQTPPPALLSYNMAGTNHTFRPSLFICRNCHPVNTSLGPLLQAEVRMTLDLLEKSIVDKIKSRNTGTAIAEIVDMGEHGRVNLRYRLETGLTSTVTTNVNVGSIPGLSIRELGTDSLAKALWNFYLIKQDKSFGVHNPDFTVAVLGSAQHAVDGIPDTLVPSSEL